jgi:hypothetical protein
VENDEVGYRCALRDAAGGFLIFRASLSALSGAAGVFA